MGRQRRRRPKLTRDEILAELRALLRREMSLQVTNASETEAGFNSLPQKRRKEVKDQIKRRFPTR